MNRKGKKSSRASGPKPRLRIDASVDEEIDLHGLAIDEAMALVELAMDRYRNRPGARLRIIHGHSSGGTDSIKGALLRRLASVWKRQVASFRPDPGNPGSTLLFLVES